MRAPEKLRTELPAPFVAITGRTSSPKSLEAFLADPHPKMPNISLSRSEISDIVAYILSLRVDR